MHKEARPFRASRSKRAAIGVFILLGLICFAVARSRSTSASLTIVRFGTNRDAFAMLQFSNAGPATISYFGYATNQPLYRFQIQTPAGLTNINQFFCGTGVGEFELKPRQSMDFQMWMSGHYQDYRVALYYRVPDSLDWFRDHVPYRISRWLPQPRSRIALSLVIHTNSPVTVTEVRN